jgi:hypothetical protein
VAGRLPGVAARRPQVRVDAARLTTLRDNLCAATRQLDDACHVFSVILDEIRANISCCPNEWLASLFRCLAGLNTTGRQGVRYQLGSPDGSGLSLPTPDVAMQRPQLQSCYQTDVACPLDRGSDLPWIRPGPSSMVPFLPPPPTA